MSLPPFNSLRGRYLYLGLLFCLALAITAYVSQDLVYETNQHNVEQLRTRTQILQDLNSLDSNINKIHRELERYLLHPKHTQDGIFTALLAQVQSDIEVIINHPWINEAAYRKTLAADLRLANERMSLEINNLLKIRENVRGWFPATRIMLDEMFVANSEVFGALNTAIDDTSPGLDEARIREAHLHLQSLRHHWAKLILNFRLFVSNRFGVFGRHADAQPILLDNIALHQTKIEQSLGQLDSQKRDSGLPLEAVSALEVVQVQFARWQKGLREVTELLKTEEWREDITRLENRIDPLMDVMHQSVYLLQRELQNSASQDAGQLVKAAGDVNHAIWVLTVCGIIITVIGMYVTHRTIVRPISEVAQGLRREAHGQKTRLKHTRHTPEISDLIEAFEYMRKQIRARYDEVSSMRDEAMAASQAKSQFLARMSHELRTPLNAIIGLSELLHEEMKDEELTDLIGDVDTIHAAGNHLLILVNDILDLAKIEAGKVELFAEEFDLDQMLDMVEEVAHPLARNNNNQLTFERVDMNGTMVADQTKVRQCLFNFISNACKFTKHGRVNLTAARQFRNGIEWIVFTVADTGIGIREDQISRLFKKFSQADQSTSREYGGAGLGLALTYEFCKLMGGEITVESTPGVGSTFTFRIPRYPGGCTIRTQPPQPRLSIGT